MRNRRLDWRVRFSQATVGFPSWSPARSDRLVFVSDEGGVSQVWTAAVTGAERVPVTHQRVGVEEFVLAPDGERVAWWRDESGDGNGGWVATPIDEPERADELLRGLPAGWSEGLAWAADGVAAAISDGENYRIYCGTPGEAARLIYESTSPAGLGREWTTSAGGLSADGSLVCIRHSEQGDMLHFGLRVLRARDGSAVADIVDAGKTVRVCAWSPVSGDQRVAIIHERDGIERPAVWSPVAGERHDYSSDLPGEIDVNGWYPDGAALLVTHWHEGHSQLYRLDVATGDYQLLADPGGYISAAAVRPDGAIWMRDESGLRAPVVRSLEGSTILAAPGSVVPGTPSRSVRFAGPSGDPTHMLVAEPAGTGPHPTVMYVHGGPEWAEADSYDPWTATLVDHGVLVAKVNYRGSTGFGEAWRTSIHDGNIGFPEVSDVISGLTYLIDVGLSDPHRCAIEGWSWGGYIAALAIGAHPEAFAAAIAGIPVCDSVMTHEDCSPSQQAYDRAIMGGSPTEFPERYAERSPSTYLDAVRTPVLIIAGEHDSACPIRQVRWYADELHKRGRDVRLHVYDAGHHANSTAERVAQVELALEFLEQHGLLTRDA